MEGRELVAISAALIAAVLAVAKLVADKESRISDFRKDWINSYRAALSEMLGEAYAIAGRIRIRTKHAELAEAKSSSAGSSATAAPTTSATLTEKAVAESQTTLLGDGVVQVVVTISRSGHSDETVPASVPAAAVPDGGTGAVGATPASPTGAERAGLLSAEEILELEKDLTPHWNTLRKAHRTVLLHMNFNETAWGTRNLAADVDHPQKAKTVWRDLVTSCRVLDKSKVENAFVPDKNGVPSGAAVLLVDQLEHLIEKLLGEYHEVGKEDRYTEIKEAIDRSTLLGNLVLKPEWNRIKGGEPKFNRVVFGMGGLASLGFLALLYLALVPKKSPEPASPSHVIVELKEKLTTPPLECSEMISLGDAWSGRGPISSNLPWCPPPGI
ncbi:hypothetical protein ACODUL_08285 [Stenotrophomonas maltophilia]